MNEMLAIRPTQNKAFIIHMKIVLAHVTQIILQWKIKHYIVCVNDFNKYKECNFMFYY